MMIYIITEKMEASFSDEKIVGAVSDKAFAKRYCRDMRTKGELTFREVELDGIIIPKEKLYRIEYELYMYDDSDDIVQVFNEILKEAPIVYIEEIDWLNNAYGCMRAIRLVNEPCQKMSFWCYAKSATGATRILKKMLKGFDPSVLEWGVYYPLEKDKGTVVKRFSYYNHKHHGK